MSPHLIELIAWIGIGILLSLGILAVASALKVRRLTAAEAARLARLTLRQIKRLIVLVVGVTVVIVGIIMIVAPGPAIIVIPLGLGVLASEFVWARRLLKTYKNYAVNFKNQAEANEVSRPRPLLAVFVLAATLGAVLFTIYVSHYPPKRVLAVAGPLFGLECFWCFLMISRYRKHKEALRRGTPLLPPPPAPTNVQAQPESPTDTPH